MQSVINNADAEEQRGRNNTMREHLEHRALHALRRDAKDTDRHKAHVSNGRISDQLLHIFLHKRDERGIDHGNNAQAENQRREIFGSLRQHRQREPEKTITAHLQQDTGQNNGTCCRRFNVRIRQPGMHRPHRHLDGEGGHKREEYPFLHCRRYSCRQQRGDICGAELMIHRQNGDQQQYRAEQRIEEELEGCINTVFAAPDTDDQIHRDQHRFKEDVEQHQIQRQEHAEHHGLQQHERHHIFAHTLLDRLPARQNTDRRQQRGEKDKENGNPVDAHLVGDVETGQPVMLFNKLEFGRGFVKAHIHVNREHECRKRDDKRDDPRISCDGFLTAPYAENQQYAKQRQEGHER